MQVKRQHTPLTATAYQAIVMSVKDQEPSPWALNAVRYIPMGGNRRIELAFVDFSVCIPLSLIDELSGASIKDLQQLRLTPAGDTIVSDALDLHISVEGLVKDILSENPNFSQIVSTLFATRAGKKISDKKRITSAENGKKGGRPRKRVRKPAEVAHA